MEELKKLKVAIFGKSYSITTDENENDVFQAVELVNSLMKAIAGKTQLQDDSKIAVLAALQLANDLSKSRRLLDLWQTRAQDLDSLLAGQVEKQ